MHSKKNFGHESEGPLQLKIAIKETTEEVEPFSEPGSIGEKIQLWAALNFRAMPNTILGSEGIKYHTVSRL
jgi:hypothetical protein